MLSCLEFPPSWRCRTAQPWGHVVSMLPERGLRSAPAPLRVGPWPSGPPSGPLSSPHSEWGTQRLEVSHVHKVESVIPWLNDALVFFTVSLQLCQQLKDKVGIWGQDRAGPHPEEASQSTGHSAPSFGMGVGMPRAPCVSPKHPLILSSVTLSAHTSWGWAMISLGNTCLLPATWPLGDRGYSRADPLARPLITSSISLLPRSLCSPATGAAGLSEQSAQEPVPWEWSPGHPSSLHLPPAQPECQPGPGTAGYLFPPSRYPACHPCTDGMEHWIRWEEGTPVGFLFWMGKMRRHKVSSSPHPGLPTGQELLDLGWNQALLPSPFISCLARPLGGRGAATYLFPLEPKGWAGREEGQKRPSPRAVVSLTAFTQQPWWGVQEIKIV